MHVGLVEIATRIWSGRESVDTVVDFQNPDGALTSTRHISAATGEQEGRAHVTVSRVDRSVEVVIIFWSQAPVMRFKFRILQTTQIEDAATPLAAAEMRIMV